VNERVGDGRCPGPPDSDAKNVASCQLRVHSDARNVASCQLRVHSSLKARLHDSCVTYPRSEGIYPGPRSTHPGPGDTYSGPGDTFPGPKGTHSGPGDTYPGPEDARGQQNLETQASKRNLLYTNALHA